MDHLVCVAVGISLLAFAGGLAIFSVMFDWLPDAQFTEIEPGNDFVSIEIEGRADGHLDLWFSTMSTTEIRALLFEEDEYKVYLSGGAAHSIFSIEGSSGNFSSGVGRQVLHLVFERASIGSSNAIEITYQISVTGVIVEYLGAAAAVAAVGICLVAFGLWRGFVRGRVETHGPP